MLKIIKRWILNIKVADLYNTIGEEDILKDWKIGNKELNEAERKYLISEATILLNSKLWKLLKREVQYRANEAMYKKSKSIEDITAGKMILYTLDIIESKLKKITA